MTEFEAEYIRQSNKCPDCGHYKDWGADKCYHCERQTGGLVIDNDECSVCHRICKHADSTKGKTTMCVDCLRECND